MSARKIKVLIADDEAPARNRMKTLLEPYGQMSVCAEAEDGDQVLKMIIGKAPDLAFLDINMPGASVFSTIPSLKNPPLVVFQTAYSKYAADAFDIDAVDYLMKPVSRERFDRAMQKVMEKLGRDENALPPGETQGKSEKSGDVISVKSGEALRIIRIDTIRRISFEEGFSYIYCGEERIYSDEPLSRLASRLESRGFYQVSRSDMINLKNLSKLHPFFNGRYIAELTNGEKIHVSRRRVQGLKELIGD